MPDDSGAFSGPESGSTGRLMDPNYRTPVTEELNGGYTWAINCKSVFEAEYVHVLSLHENKTINVDPNIPVDPNNITTLSRTGARGRILPSAGRSVRRSWRAATGQRTR